MIFPPSPNEIAKDNASPGSLGLSIQLLLGPAAVMPAPDYITQAIKSIEVTNTDKGRSGFQITFAVGRGYGDTEEYPLFDTTLIRPFTRVMILVNIGILPKVLFDGFITHHQFNPSGSPGESTFTVTGEDYSILMDMIELTLQHPAQPDYIIVNKIILQYGLVPIVFPPIQFEVPNPLRHNPTQIGTDFSYVQQLAQKYNYVFYIEPTDLPGVNNAYWGPSLRLGLPQKALTVNMGPATNLNSISFQTNALEPKMVGGLIEDELAQNMPIPVIAPMPLPPYLATKPAHIFNLPFVKVKLYKSKGKHNVLQAYIEAFAEVDSSKDVLTASGEVDTLRYGDILSPRKPVSLRGVGHAHDGLYYVNSVTHKLEHGSYKQNFNLTREGYGSTIPGVTPGAIP